MEAISQSLQPHKELVGQIAGIVTIAQFFSGGFVCWDIHKKGTTRGFNPMPFIGGLTMGILSLKYGLLLNDAVMITVNIAAIILNILYCVFYYKMAEDKYEEVLKPSGYAVGLLAVFLGYALVESTENIEFRFGFILTVLMLALLGAPLVDVKDILAKKDASGIPFPITLMGAVVTFMWLLYGIILQNNFMIIQNLVGYILCTVQLVLIFMYPGVSANSPPGQGQSKRKKNVKKE